MAELLTSPGALIMNLVLLWLFLRLVVRVLVFPGSIILWRRNTEASYRSEMAKQFSYHIEQLCVYLDAAINTDEPKFIAGSCEGAMLGCMVIEGLSRNFRVQQRDQVRFTTEQARVRLLVQAVERFLGEARVQGTSDAKVPMLDWLSRMSQRLVPVPLKMAVIGSPLTSETLEAAKVCNEHLLQLLSIFGTLQQAPEGCCAAMRKFLRVPTIGSLDQLRAELLTRYSGRHCWVRTPGGRKIDGMFIPCLAQASGGSGAPEDGPNSEGNLSSSAKEDGQLKELVSGLAQWSSAPLVVWCNPNAAYYETMAFESHWLDFYLNQGCSVFLFNYSGFGRSEGSPSPKSLAEDANSVIDFLKRRGFDNIGVHGRSIGGIAACSLAAVQSDVLKFFVADRTFSTLSKAAKHTFGNWATYGLGLSGTWADNCDNYLKARCYKVLICDPRDVTIPDLASLRTAVAKHAVRRLAPKERFELKPDQVRRIVDAWIFLETVIKTIDNDDIPEKEGQSSPKPPSAKRPARQPVVGKPLSDVSSTAEEDTARLVAGSRPTGQRSSKISNCLVTWVADHPHVVKAVLAAHVGQLRLAFELAGSQINAGGGTLDDALGGRCADEAAEGLKCFLANMQVWGSLGTIREHTNPAADTDLEMLLQKGLNCQDVPGYTSRTARIAAQVSPDNLAVYHRQLVRSSVINVRRRFKRQCEEIRRGFESSTRDESAMGVELRSTVMGHLCEIEYLFTGIHSFFKFVDSAGSAHPSGASSSNSAFNPDTVSNDDESEVSASLEDGRCTSDPFLAKPLPAVDRDSFGYLMCLECGHNGILSASESQHLSFHIQAAGFGKWSQAYVAKSPQSCSPQRKPAKDCNGNIRFF